MSSSSTAMIPSSPAEIIAGSDDLLSEILSRLPVKPLLRFKSVCKQWLSLISSSSFSLLHSFRHCRRPSSALFFLHHHRHRHPCRSLPSLSYEFVPLHPSSPPPFLSRLRSHPLDILQSCNGLLLCCSSSSFFVFNPSTNQMATIALPRRLVLGIGLAFDLSRSANYEIVCVWKVDEGLYAIDVYYSMDRQWRQVVDFFTAPFDVEFERGVYCDSRVYWLSHTDATVAFNLDEKCVETVVLPISIEGAYIERFRYFGESCGHLHLIEIRTNCVSDFKILELDRREKMGWFVKYKANLDVVGRGFEAEMFQDHSDRFGFRLRFYAFSILAVSRQNESDNDDDDGDAVGPELVVSVPGKVISYNLKSEVSRFICDVFDESDKWFPFKGYNAHQFIESLYRL